MSNHSNDKKASAGVDLSSPDGRPSGGPPPSPRHRSDNSHKEGSGRWKALAVRIILFLLLLLGVFATGNWIGRMRAMHERSGAGVGVSSSEPRSGQEALYWTCSMHPQVKLPKAGQCPICFMDLVPVRSGGDDPDAPELTLSARARVLARVETAPVEHRELTHEVRMVGKVAADETRITYVSSYIPGRLDRLFVNYTGIRVKKGDHLAEIYSPDLLVAQREYLVALENAEKFGGNRPATDLSVAGAANALVEAAQRKLELWGIARDVLDKLARERQPSDHIRIDSPLEGWVLERQGYPGMYVETGTRIFTLADLRSIWVLLDAYELDIGFIRLAQEVEFETEAYPGQIFKGRVAYIDPVLRPDTRTINVRVNVDNPDLRLRPEMFVRARLQVRLGEGGQVVSNALVGKWVCYMHPEVVKDGPGQCDVCGMDLVEAASLGYAGSGEVKSGALAIPQTAVLLTGKRAVVYVEHRQGDETRYEGRVVRLGPRAGDSFVVLDGLREGERVATQGALMIDSALQIQAKPSMMQPREEGPPDATGTSPAEEPPIVSRHVSGAMYHQHVAPVIDAYLELVGALAEDDAGASAAAMSRLRDALKKTEPHGLKQEADEELFNTRVAALASSLPPEKALVIAIREKLPGVTRAMETYLQTFGHNRRAPLLEAFCPMAFDDRGAAWLQAGEQISNPYFGHKMLRCGMIRARIAADGKVSR
ncbi:MAG TPA: efflux RND transporter periplasmic adaptor subunit [Phycisphaerae bacterium]|nr:efflux RND transporter periplasmic adaptor subunit [Phycisphaerae bacterium]